jgi:hypothetical protein
MKTLFKGINKLTDQDLYDLCEAIDGEMQRRTALTDDVPESARRRAVERTQSYRHRTGAGAPPIKAVGLGKPRRAA